jgi:hypothetical protein
MAIDQHRPAPFARHVSMHTVTGVPSPCRNGAIRSVLRSTTRSSYIEPHDLPRRLELGQANQIEIKGFADRANWSLGHGGRTKDLDFSELELILHLLPVMKFVTQPGGVC